jgi:hypothetical protein
MGGLGALAIKPLQTISLASVAKSLDKRATPTIVSLQPSNARATILRSSPAVITDPGKRLDPVGMVVVVCTLLVECRSASTTTPPKVSLLCLLTNAILPLVVSQEPILATLEILKS